MNGERLTRIPLRLVSAATGTTIDGITIVAVSEQELISLEDRFRESQAEARRYREALRQVAAALADGPSDELLDACYEAVQALYPEEDGK